MKDLIFFIRLFKPYQNWLISGIVLSLLTSLGGIALFSLSGWLVSSAAIASLNVIHELSTSFNYLQPAAEIRGLAIIRTLSRYGERVVTHEATFRVLAQIRIWFFAKMIPLSTGRLTLLRSGDLLSNMTSDIDALDALYLRLINPIIVATIGLSIVLSVIAYYHWLISINTLIIWMIASILVPFIFNRLGNNNAKAIVSLMANYKNQQIELTQGIRDLILFQAYSSFQQKLLHISNRLIETQRANQRLTALSSALTLLISSISLLFTLILISNALNTESITSPQAGLLLFCIIAGFELITPLSPAMQLLGKTQQAAKNIREVASLTPTIIEPKQAKSLPSIYDLTLNSIYFRYSESSAWILNNLSLTIPQGSKIAIIGNSGLGKTSLLQLLMRFFDPQQGRILLNGIDYREFHSEELLQSFALLSQRTQLFASSIKANLLMAKPEATDEELHQALLLAGLDNFIQQLPEGLETWVGEHGVKVSGGEARRIALARVYLKNAPILLLDEPTEGLDSETEAQVLATLAKISVDKTVIMVTHRLAGLEWVDHIYHLSEGDLKLKLLK